MKLAYILSIAGLVIFSLYPAQQIITFPYIPHFPNDIPPIETKPIDGENVISITDGKEEVTNIINSFCSLDLPIIEQVSLPSVSQTEYCFSYDISGNYNTAGNCITPKIFDFQKNEEQDIINHIYTYTLFLSLPCYIFLGMKAHTI